MYTVSVGSNSYMYINLAMSSISYSLRNDKSVSVGRSTQGSGLVRIGGASDNSERSILSLTA